MSEQIGYIVGTQTYVLASDADIAIEQVKNGEGSVVSRTSQPKPQPTQTNITGSRIQGSAPQATLTKLPTSTATKAVPA